MTVPEQDPDVVRWGLHHLLDFFTFPTDGSHIAVTNFINDSSKVGYVREGYLEPEHIGYVREGYQEPEHIGYVREGYYEPEHIGYVREGYQEPVLTNVENDAVIARTLQEEYSRLAAAEASGVVNFGQDSILAQDWHGSSRRCVYSGHENDQEAANDPSKNRKEGDDYSKKMAAEADDHSKMEADDSSKKKNEDVQINSSSSCSEVIDLGINSSASCSEDKSLVPDDLLRSLEITDDDSILDGEVGKRLNQMVPIPHVPKINGEIPSADEEISDHQRLLDRLQLYELVENTVQGDGNCQFRAISDQLYRTPDHHKDVREQVVKQLKSHPEMYEGYVPMGYGAYLKKMIKSGEWGDHVTLQAAADWFGVKIFMITSFKDTCYIEIIPVVQKTKRVIFLSFWAEVHYNSIYLAEELPFLESKKKKKWWMLGS